MKRLLLTSRVEKRKILNHDQCHQDRREENNGVSGVEEGMEEEEVTVENGDCGFADDEVSIKNERELISLPGRVSGEGGVSGVSEEEEEEGKEEEEEEEEGGEEGNYIHVVDDLPLEKFLLKYSQAVVTGIVLATDVTTGSV